MSTARATTYTGVGDCISCGSSLVSFNGVYEGYVCADCGDRWAESTPCERTFRISKFGDRAYVLEWDVPVTVMYAPVDEDLISVSEEGSDESHDFRLDDGTAVSVKCGEEVTVAHEDDPWTEIEAENFRSD